MKISDKVTIVMVGRSGSGKGTQAKLIAEKLGRGAHRVETGKLLRSIMKKKNLSARLARQAMKKGLLFPSWFAAYVWMDDLIGGGKADKSLVFDGSPRSLFEARFIDDFIKWHERPLPICIYIDVEEKEAEKRLLSRGREDDKLPAIRSRLAYFKKNVLPVIDFYKKSDRLIHINGNPPPEIVWQEIDKFLRVKRLF